MKKDFEKKVSLTFGHSHWHNRNHSFDGTRGDSFRGGDPGEAAPGPGVGLAVAAAVVAGEAAPVAVVAAAVAVLLVVVVVPFL